MLRKVTLLSLLSLTVGEWNKLNGRSRINLMERNMQESTTVRAQSIISYLEQSTEIYYPGYEELIVFFNLLLSIGEESYNVHELAINKAANKAMLLLNRLLSVPPNNDHLMRITEMLGQNLIKRFIVKVDNKNISLNFNLVLQESCWYHHDLELCAKATNYMKQLAGTIYKINGKLVRDNVGSSIPDNVKANSIVQENDIYNALHNELKRIIANDLNIDESFKRLVTELPWVYEMYFGTRRFFDVLLANPKNNGQILEYSPIPFFDLRRIEDSVDCHLKLAETMGSTKSSLYIKLEQDWKGLPSNCLNGQTKSDSLRAQKLHDTLELYRIALRNPTMKTTTFAFKPTAPQLDAMLIVAQVGLSNIDVYKLFPQHYYSVCQLFQHPEYIATSVIDHSRDINAPLIDLFNSSLTEQCDKGKLEEGMLNYATWWTNHKSRPFPLALIKHYTELPITTDQNKRLRILNNSSDNLRDLESRNLLIQDIKGEKKVGDRKLNNKTLNQLFRIIGGKNFFSSEFISLEFFDYLTMFYTRHLLMSNTGDSPINKGDLFNRFIANAKIKHLLWLGGNREFMLRLLHEESKEHNIGNFLEQIQKRVDKAALIQLKVEKYRESEREKKGFFGYLIAPTPFPTLIENHQSLFRTIINSFIYVYVFRSYHDSWTPRKEFLEEKSRLACLEAIALKTKHVMPHIYNLLGMSTSDIEKAKKYFRVTPTSKLC